MYYISVGTLRYRRRSIGTCLRPGVPELSDVFVTRAKSERMRAKSEIERSCGPVGGPNEPLPIIILENLLFKTANWCTTEIQINLVRHPGAPPG